MNIDDAVDAVVNAPPPPPDFMPPPDATLPMDPADDPRAEMRGLSEEERRQKIQQILRRFRAGGRELKAWWFGRMRRSSDPFGEKLALFWHGHFATSIVKVRHPRFMWLQNDLFRRMGRGDFMELLLEAGRDPAMLIWLDGATSTRAKPNENYGRELLELFTLGEGNYSEDDIRAAARAHTGWTVDRIRQEARFRPFQHDDGRKVFLKKHGTFNDQDIVGILSGEEACARWISGRLWNYLAGAPAPPAFLRALASEFIREKGAVNPLLQSILRSAEFHSPAVVWKRIKCPADWFCGLDRALDLHRLTDGAAHGLSAALGLDLFQPPSVKGWDGGRAWINANTLLLRNNAAIYFIEGGDPRDFGISGQLQGAGMRFARRPPADPTAVESLSGLDNTALAARLFGTTPGDPFLKTLPPPPDHASTTARIRHFVTLPEYQLG